VTSLGLGPPQIRRPRLDAQTLALALREVLDNELIQERTREFAARLAAWRERAPDPASWFERV
jgi:hypothetical protein